VVDCVDVGLTRKSVPENYNSNDFMSLTEYVTAAEKAVRYFMPLLKPEMTKYVVKDEDVISCVAYAMMLADWKWEEGRGRTRRSYRNDYACYALRAYIVRKSQFKNKFGNILSLDKELSDMSERKLKFSETLVDKSMRTPIEIICGTKYENDLQRIMNCNTLNEREQFCLREYYFEHKTYDEIGSILGITKQRVHQNLNDAKRKIQEEINVQLVS
jgi:RNA polymerase sigma factor (sigma-70 family)